MPISHAMAQNHFKNKSTERNHETEVFFSRCYSVFMRAISHIIWYIFFLVFIKFIWSSQFGFFPCNLSIILRPDYHAFEIWKPKNFQSFFLLIHFLRFVLFCYLFRCRVFMFVFGWKWGVGERCLHAIHLLILLVHSNTVIHFVDGSQTDTKVFN